MFTRDGVPVAGGMGTMGDMLSTDTAISAGSGGVGSAAQAEAVTEAVQVAQYAVDRAFLPPCHRATAGRLV